MRRTTGLSISAAAERLRTTPRMLRYREALGLLPPGRGAGAHRRYTERDLRAAALAIAMETRYDVSPRALAFALRAASDLRLGAELRELAEVSGAAAPGPTRALDFEQQKAQRLLRPPGHPNERDVVPSLLGQRHVHS